MGNIFTVLRNQLDKLKITVSKIYFVDLNTQNNK
jgi:hypothetical protein